MGLSTIELLPPHDLQKAQPGNHSNRQSLHIHELLQTSTQLSPKQLP